MKVELVQVSVERKRSEKEREHRIHGSVVFDDIFGTPFFQLSHVFRHRLVVFQLSHVFRHRLVFIFFNFKLLKYIFQILHSNRSSYTKTSW